jgi:hypothetical protein
VEGLIAIHEKKAQINNVRTFATFVGFGDNSDFVINSDKNSIM